MLWFFESFFPVVWIAFIVYWRIKAAGTKSTQRREPVVSGILRLVAFLVVIVLLSTTRIPVAWLYRQLWPAGIWPFCIGAVVTLLGLSFAVWARQHLASNWSSAVTIKEGHELITSGPYALVRHPIYTGILTGFIGTAIALAQVRGVIGFALILIVLWSKLRIEEQWSVPSLGKRTTRMPNGLRC
jgi:protein-S-isoprenylcysteine O-methyltransferase Ste14